MRSPAKQLPVDGPNLKDFLVAGRNLPDPNKIPTTATADQTHPYLLAASDYHGAGRRVYFEVYGCQMNVSDTEIVWTILQSSGYTKVDEIRDADVVMVITCAIREGAETKIWNRLRHIAALKRTRPARRGILQVAVLGCMAERLKTQLLERERYVDVVAGPDSYKDLPRLLAITQSGDQRAANVLLSLEETYADIMPMRLNAASRTAFVSIMRGCDNMCSYCIVPFTRGKERSRPLDSIVGEVEHLVREHGIREITLLGQNVNSYRDLSGVADGTKPSQTPSSLATGFRTVYKTKVGGARFAQLLDEVARRLPQTRIRFTSPHPKDFPDEVLHVMGSHANICKQIHMPAQAGSSTVLERMRRGYTREAYVELVQRVRELLPGVALSSDFICGFCGESEAEFEETLSLLEEVQYQVAYLFAYSMREKTTAHRRFVDDVPEAVKKERLRRMIEVFRRGATAANARCVGEEQTILVEGVSDCWDAVNVFK